MKYERFEDLPVWKASIELARRVYVLTKARCFRGPGDLCDQLRRAALSVSNNIAEGFERGSTSELLMFLYIARGSAGEVRSMLRFSVELLRVDTLPTSPDSELSSLRSEITALIAIAESCSRQIRGWADALQNTDIQGPRHLNDKTRLAYEQRTRAEEFHRQIDSRFRQAHPDLFPPQSAD
jgi:four helix bundle protein